MSVIFIARHGRILAGVLRKTECKTVTKVTDSTESSLDVRTHTCNNPTETFHYTNFYAGRPLQLREILNPPPPSPPPPRGFPQELQQSGRETIIFDRVLSCINISEPFNKKRLLSYIISFLNCRGIKIMKQIRELRSLLAGLIAQCSLSPKRAPSFTVRVMMYCVP